MTSAESDFPGVYAVAGKNWSILDLVGRFDEPAYLSSGVSRLSDLHLKAGRPAHYRFDGELVSLPQASNLDEKTICDLISPLLSEEKRAQLGAGLPIDIDAGWEWREKKLNFRLNVFRDRDGVCCALRVLAREIPPLDGIGFPFDRTWQEIVDLTQGLVIVTGVTGCGKSTTIASLLQHRNAHRAERIITLEDPVEYILKSDKALISQRELGQNLPTFHDGLRSALREDPDVIFVGEIRDADTAQLALTAAETGHVVLTTMHTRDTRGAITRLIDLFPAERMKELASQISFALEIVIGQKLVPKANGEGRRAVMEVMVNSVAIAHLIRTGKLEQIYAQLETQRKEGCITLERHLLMLLESGEVEKGAALQAANNSTLHSLLGSR